MELFDKSDLIEYYIKKEKTNKYNNIYKKILRLYDKKDLKTIKKIVKMMSIHTIYKIILFFDYINIDEILLKDINDIYMIKLDNYFVIK